MMKSLVAGKTVTVTYFQRDRYGRILGQVYAPDGMNINQFMVRAGAAWVYEQYNTDPVLPVLQNEARQQKRGLWSDADPVPPPGYGDTVNKAMAILSFICSQRE
ncbi:yeaA protein [Escherichia coli 2-427-07_S3_C3]|nr:yeaA protein [Escherichia coli 2-427-07_S3_C3]